MEIAMIGLIVASMIAGVLLIVIVTYICYAIVTRRFGSTKFGLQDGMRIQRLPIYGAPLDRENITRSNPGTSQTVSTGNRIFRPIPFDMTNMTVAAQTFPRVKHKKSKKRKRISNNVKMHLDGSKTEDDIFDSREGGDGTSSDADSEASSTRRYNNNQITRDMSKRRATIDFHSTTAFTRNMKKNSQSNLTKWREPIYSSVRNTSLKSVKKHTEIDDGKVFTDGFVIASQLRSELDLELRREGRNQRVNSLTKSRSEPRLAMFSYAEENERVVANIPHSTSRSATIGPSRESKKSHTTDISNNFSSYMESTMEPSTTRRNTDYGFPTCYSDMLHYSIDGSTNNAKIIRGRSESDINKAPNPYDERDSYFIYSPGKKKEGVHFKQPEKARQNIDHSISQEAETNQYYTENKKYSSEFTEINSEVAEINEGFVNEVVDKESSQKRNTRSRLPTPPPKLRYSTSLVVSPIELDTFPKNPSVSSEAGSNYRSPTVKTFTQNNHWPVVNSSESSTSLPVHPSRPLSPVVLEGNIRSNENHSSFSQNAHFDQVRDDELTSITSMGVRKKPGELNVALTSLHEEMKLKLKERLRSVDGQHEENNETVIGTDVGEQVDNNISLDHISSNARFHQDDPHQLRRVNIPPFINVHSDLSSNNNALPRNNTRVKYTATNDYTDRRSSPKSGVETNNIREDPYSLASREFGRVPEPPRDYEPISERQNRLARMSDFVSVPIPAPDYEEDDDVTISYMPRKVESAHRFLGRSLKSVNRDETNGGRRLSIDSGNSGKSKSVQFTEKPPDIIPDNFLDINNFTKLSPSRDNDQVRNENRSSSSNYVRYDVGGNSRVFSANDETSVQGYDSDTSSLPPPPPPLPPLPPPPPPLSLSIFSHH